MTEYTYRMLGTTITVSIDGPDNDHDVTMVIGEDVVYEGAGEIIGWPNMAGLHGAARFAVERKTVREWVECEIIWALKEIER